ncbi:MAG: hypothetical protein RR678_04010 [Lachnospiraceae bacterium]
MNRQEAKRTHEKMLNIAEQEDKSPGIMQHFTHKAYASDYKSIDALEYLKKKNIQIKAK